MTLHRLLLKEIALPLLLALALVSQLLVLMQVLQLNDVLFGAGFDPLGVLRISAALAPHFAVSALPLAFLLAVLLGVGRLAEDNELTALSALGRSPWALYAVPLALGLALAAATHPLVSTAEPRGLRTIHRILNELIKRNVAGNIQPGVLNEDIPDFTVYVAKREGPAGDPTWRNVLVRDGRGAGAAALVLARTGRVPRGGQEQALEVELRDGELHRLDPSGEYSRARFDKATMALGIVRFLRKHNNFIAPTDEMDSDELSRAAQEATAAGDQVALRRIEVARHGRRAAVLACPAFALLGVPLAARRRSTRARSYMETLAAFTGYYVVTTLGRGLGETGRLAPAAAAWLPIAAALAVAAVLYLRLRRDTAGSAR